MKQKGITVIEQHVEKMVLFAAVAIALFFGALQFLGEGNTSDFNGKTVPAVRLDKELIEHATDIQGRLSNDAQSTYSEPERNNPADDFRTRLQGSISPDTFGNAPQYAMVPETGLSADSDKEYLVPKPVAMSTPLVDQHLDALHEDEVAALSVEHNDFLNDIFGNLPDTHDISWTTPFAVVDWKAIRDQLSVEDPSGEKLGIPNHWYRDRVFAFNLKIERETEQDNGGWSELTIIESLPLLPSLKDYIEKEDLAGYEKDNALDWLEVLINQASIIQPQFYATKGDYWSFPVNPVERDEDAGDEMQGIYDFQDEIARIEGKLSRLRATLKRLEEREDEEQNEGGGNIGGGGGGGGIGGGGGGLQPPGGGGGGGSDPDKPAGIQKAIEKYKKQIEIQEQLLESKKEALDALALELGIDLDEEIQEHTLVDLEKDDISLVWGHDVTVVPGKTYRYRLTLQIYNPFFDKDPVLVEAQKDLAKSVVMDVQTSEWSEPISIKERTRFFVTRAMPEDGNALRVGRATVEVYHIYDGSWYSKKYNDVMPGDPIGQMEKVKLQDDFIDVDYATDFFMLDILKRPADRNNVAGQMKGSGKAIIAAPDGSIIMRDPEMDSKNPERIKLEEYSNNG